MDSYILFTDGSCSPNPGPGGWAAILRNDKGNDKIFTGNSKNTTNNRMEMLAVLEPLESLNEPSEVLVIADSEYVIKGLTTWMHSWKLKGWRRKAGKIENLEIWKRLDSQWEKHEIKTEWTRGHSGHKENELCDKLANEAREASF